ncbi:MAG: Zeta toxin family protein, partial [Elusimicrobia bacterium]|nr:Zeta toxin family protein [Elusimicrobiota bacterium]
INFGFETTLSGKTYLNYFKNLKNQGYKLHLFFLWIPNTQLALARIKDRVSHGGHNVPCKDVQRRFKRSICNFFNLYLSLSDTWLLFDNSGENPKLIAKRDNLHIDVRNKILFQKILNNAGVKL